MRVEVVAVGTELLLGQIIDTNSAWIGERLALAGLDSHFQTKVGDNRLRLVAALRTALARSDAVIVCGGLGPTPDDLTRQALAEVMGTPLVRDQVLVKTIEAIFATRSRPMADSNCRQADVPLGATVIPQMMGTAPGLICPVGDDSKVIYAVPGVPHEMVEMIERAVIPDLCERAGDTAVIVSRIVRTWGESESRLAELVAPRLEALDITGNPTLAFLVRGVEGIWIRITAKAPNHAIATELVAAEEAELRALLGPLVFGVDDQTMEEAVAALLVGHHLTLAVAESLTGGMVGARLTAVRGSSGFFKGAVVAYDRQVKLDLLGVPEGPVVSADAVRAMALGVTRLLGAEVGLATTGVAGPAEQEGQPVGTVFLGLALDGSCEALQVRFTGDRDNIRQLTTISVLNVLRLRLLERPSAVP